MSRTKDEALKHIQDSEATDYEVFTTDEHTKFLENHLEAEIDKKIKVDIGKVHQRYEDDIFQITGLRKKDGQKAYNFMKEVLDDFKTKAKSNPELQQEIETLKEKIKNGLNGEGVELLKKEIEKLEHQFQEGKETWDTEKKDLLTAQQDALLGNEMDKAIIGFKFLESIPESVRNVMIEKVKTNLIPTAKMVENKLIFVDKEGLTLRNPSTMNPFTVKEMLQDQLKVIIGEERNIEGPGIKPEIVAGKKKGDKDIHLSIPDAVKTKGQLSEHLLAQGLTRDSEEYQLAYAKYSEALKYA